MKKTDSIVIVIKTTVKRRTSEYNSEELCVLEKTETLVPDEVEAHLEKTQQHHFTEVMNKLAQVAKREKVAKEVQTSAADNLKAALGDL